MRLCRSQCDHLRRLCSGSIADTSRCVIESITCALGLSSERFFTTSAPANRFSRVKDPVSHAGAVEGEVPLSSPLCVGLLGHLTEWTVLQAQPDMICARRSGPQGLSC